VVAASAEHRRSGVDVLGDSVFQEPLGRQDRHRFGDDRFHAAEMVDMGMGVDHPGHRSLAAMVPVEPQRGGRGFLGDQRVDHDDPATALHDRHVRQVEATDLVDAVGDLVQALPRGQLGLPPQTPIRRFRAVGVQERERVVVPHHPAVGGRDGPGAQRADESAVGVGEVGAVLERKPAPRGLLDGPAHHVLLDTAGLLTGVDGNGVTAPTR